MILEIALLSEVNVPLLDYCSRFWGRACQSRGEQRKSWNLKCTGLGDQTIELGPGLTQNCICLSIYLIGMCFSYKNNNIIILLNNCGPFWSSCLVWLKAMFNSFHRYKTTPLQSFLRPHLEKGLQYSAAYKRALGPCLLYIQDVLQNPLEKKFGFKLMQLPGVVAFLLWPLDL